MTIPTPPGCHEVTSPADVPAWMAPGMTLAFPAVETPAAPLGPPFARYVVPLMAKLVSFPTVNGPTAAPTDTEPVTLVSFEKYLSQYTTPPPPEAAQA